jgi:hypothetical protein
MKVKVEEFPTWNNLVLIPETEQDQQLTEEIRKQVAEKKTTAFSWEFGDNEFPRGTIQISLHKTT